MLPELARLPGHVVWRAHGRVLLRLADTLPPGVDIHSYGVLLALADGGARSQQSLATTIKASRTTLARVAAALADQGLVERVRNPADRRSWVLTRTPRGARAVRRWERHVLELEDALTEGFTRAEREELRGLLLALVQAELDPEAPEQLLGSLSFLLTRLHFRMHRDFLSALAPLAIEPRHVGALTALTATGPVAQSELARELGVSEPGTVQIVDELQTRGLTERRRLPSDRRAQMLHLTPEAPEVLAEAGRLAAGCVDGRFGPLDAAQRRRLVELLVRLAT